MYEGARGEEKHDSEQIERWMKEGLRWGLHGAGTTREAPEEKLQRNEGGREEGQREKREKEGGKPREAPAAESAHRKEDPASPLPLQPLPCMLLQPHSPCPHYNESARLHNECINYFFLFKGNSCSSSEQQRLEIKIKKKAHMA